ncbi:hypothetical protein [Streptomyces griseorubiginosus]|uniref:hypothetical protein n=1 Tax=Streptomyces griseorubiginosus TaxID=67304 RepID=UPI002E8131EF|nr:hypothetical protein [Streptomyces griseorubiginosus]WUB46363.1 hypothetical protein OHN19_24725 [Streptomyces griseorubiginosus]WUB54884.1 hypothetical protein OG942_24730 [Streptomyces griseorubiginosus]
MDDLTRLVKMGCDAATLRECDALAIEVAELLGVHGPLRPEGRALVLQRLLADVTREQRGIALGSLKEISKEDAARSEPFLVAAAGELLGLVDENSFIRVRDVRCFQFSTTWRDLQRNRDNRKQPLAYLRAMLWVGRKCARTAAPDRKQPVLLGTLLSAVRAYLTEDASNPAATEQRKKNREILKQLVGNGLETLPVETENLSKKKQDATKRLQNPRIWIDSKHAPRAPRRVWENICKHWLESLVAAASSLALAAIAVGLVLDQGESSDNSSGKATSETSSPPTSIPMGVDVSYGKAIRFSPLEPESGDSVNVYTGEEASFVSKFSKQLPYKEAVLPLAALPPDSLTNLAGYKFTAHLELQLPSGHSCKGALIKWSIPSQTPGSFGLQEGVLGPDAPPVDVTLTPGPHGQIKKLTIRAESLNSCSPMDVIVRGPRLVRT